MRNAPSAFTMSGSAVKRNVLPIAGVILLALAYNAYCDNPSVVQRERDRVEVAVTDSTARATDALRVEMAYRESVAVAQIRRSERASTEARRTIASLRARLDDSTRAIVDTILVQDSVALQPVRDSLTLYRAMVVARDTLIQRLVYERDAYRRHMLAFQKRAERPSYAISDIAGGAVIGWGAGQENETVVLVGAAIVAVPRLARLVGSLF